MKLLIVDDELDTVACLVTLFEENPCGVTQIKTAYSGREAMSLILEDCPDIILCDIEMPQMSGLELLEWIRKMGFKSEFIFLTCHESFDYAAKAIRFQVSGYLTKPVDETAIAREVAGCIQKIKVNHYLKEYSSYGEAWKKSEAIVYQSFWDRLLFEGGNADRVELGKEIKLRGLHIDLEEKWQLVVTGVNKNERAKAAWNDQSFYFAFKQFATEILTDELSYQHIVVRWEGAFLRCFFLIPHSMAEQEELKRRCIRFVEKCDEVLFYHTNCWIGDPVSIEQLPDVKKKILSGYIENRREGPGIYGQNDVCSSQKAAMDMDKIESLLKCFEKNDRMGVISLMKEVLTGLMDKKKLVIIMQSYMQVLYAWLHENEIVAERLFDDETAQQLYLNAGSTVFDMMKWVDFSAERAIAYVEMSKKADPIVRQVKDYIKAHYDENIRRSALADMVYLTPNYLSSLFHEKTGKSITDYITECRILTAKKMLEDPGESVSNVAMACGFGNMSYFSSVFKREVGVTPNEYKNRIRSQDI